MQELTSHITSAGMKLKEAAHQFGVTQPRISDLMRGKIDLFSIDTLVIMLTTAGLHVDVRVREASCRLLCRGCFPASRDIRTRPGRHLAESQSAGGHAPEASPA